MLKYIERINQLLLFFVALIFIGIFSKELYEKLKPHEPYEGPKVSLAATSQEKEIDIEATQEINLVEILNEIYIFSVENETMDPSSYRNSISVAEFRIPTYGHSSDQTVNYIFTNENGYKKVLLEKDGLILKFLPANFGDYKDKPRFEKNVYHIVEADSDYDGFLSRSDSKSLYLSDYDGQNLTLITTDVTETYLIDENTVVIVKGSGNKKEFLKYSAKDSALYRFDVDTKLTPSLK